MLWFPCPLFCPGTYGELSVTLMERHVPLHERIALYR